MKKIRISLGLLKKILDDYLENDKEDIEMNIEDLEKVLTPKVIADNIGYELKEGYDEDGLFVATRVSFLYEHGEFYSFISPFSAEDIDIKEYREKLKRILRKEKYVYFDSLYKFIESKYNDTISIQN